MRGAGEVGRARRGMGPAPPRENSRPTPATDKRGNLPPAANRRQTFENHRSPARGQSLNPHFSPGGVMMAQEFFPQRVLGSEERSGDYGSSEHVRAEGKRTSQSAPSTVCNRKASQSNQQVAENNASFTMFQRPGEKCGLRSFP